jgi:predicted RNase H-like HicB family nuclease
MERFTAVYQNVGQGWIGYVEEIPGANTQGATIDEVRENLKDAVRLIVESNREIARRGFAGKDVVREDLLVSV